MLILQPLNEKEKGGMQSGIRTFFPLFRFEKR
jgi:hypothetical protein